MNPKHDHIIRKKNNDDRQFNQMQISMYLDGVFPKGCMNDFQQYIIETRAALQTCNRIPIGTLVSKWVNE